MADDAEIQQIFDTLMQRSSIAELSDEEAIFCIGNLIDASVDLDRKDGNDRALQWCNHPSQRKLDDPTSALIEYFRANAWGSTTAETSWT